MCSMYPEAAALSTQSVLRIHTAALSLLQYGYIMAQVQYSYIMLRVHTAALSTQLAP